MTDGVLTPHDMQGMNITLAADEYLAKPFNLKDAAMRFNKLLGLQAQEGISNLIEGSETRVLEGRNASMTPPPSAMTTPVSTHRRMRLLPFPPLKS